MATRRTKAEKRPQVVTAALARLAARPTPWVKLRPAEAIACIDGAGERRASLAATFLPRVRERAPQLRELANRLRVRDAVHRYYAQSHKLFDRQQVLAEAYLTLTSMFQAAPLHENFAVVIEDAIREPFAVALNRNWPQHARPVLEGVLLTRHVLDCLNEVAESPATELPQSLPPSWCVAVALWDPYHAPA